MKLTSADIPTANCNYCGGKVVTYAAKAYTVSVDGKIVTIYACPNCKRGLMWRTMQLISDPILVAIPASASWQER